MDNSDFPRGQAGGSLLPITAVVALSIALHSAVCAEPTPKGCNAQLLSAVVQPSATVYGVRGGGQYCEGTVPALNSGSLALIGVHLGVLPDAGTNRIQILVPANIGVAGSISMAAIDIGRAKSYRLDAEMPAGGLSIDVAPVLRPLGLTSAQLAFRASVDSGAEELMIPILLSNDTGGPVQVLYDATEAVRRFRAQIVDNADVKLQNDVVLDDVKARAPMVVSLNRSVNSRWVLVKATAYSPLNNNPMPSRTYRIFVPAKP